MSKLRAGIYAALLLFAILTVSLLLLWAPQVITVILIILAIYCVIWNVIYHNFEKEKE